MSIIELYNIFKNYPTICTDSRNLLNNSLFFALKGDKFNGNKFAEKAIQGGCKYSIIDEKEYESKNCILVDDVKSTLQELAKIHREQLNIPIIGITGTNGKTTTKELINTVLSTQYRCFCTKGNLNNQIGLPLSILSISKKHEIAVIEMGASEIGEIKNLSEIAKPNTAIITNIGKAHLEGFGSLDGVIKAKTELYTFIKKSKGLLFVNSGDKLLLKESENIKQISFGSNKKSDYKAKLSRRFPYVSIMKNNTTINSNLIGDFQFENILAASVIGDYYNISPENIKKAIENYTPKNNRTEIVTTANNYIILDAYNANPSSMESMISAFSELKKENKFCILGEMRELGEYSKEEHQYLIDKMLELKIETVFIGEEFCKTTHLNSFKNTVDFIENREKYNLKNKTFLIKGSRGIKLEDIIKYL
ncbi:UDP-N-acetylmuramoyl-tripeptide--D-alanyl-D-alanine ligase [Flavobacteriales bacterium]|nr:UDP-N-acetylmuramoyl-tripeptide--D-alanyl-D-alanine ligase [Flavobacteriales bacterium]